MSHNDLEQWFVLMHSLQHHHKYALSELENMMPWEMNIYVNLIQETLRKQQQTQQQPMIGNSF